MSRAAASPSLPITITHVNLHSPPLPVAVRRARASKRAMEREGGILRGESVRGWAAGRNRRRQTFAASDAQQWGD